MESSTLAANPETVSIHPLDIDAIRTDPNYEVTHGITGRLFCRECAAELPARIYDHLRKHGMSIATYRDRWPGAPVVSSHGRALNNANARAWRAPRKKGPRAQSVNAELLEEIRKDPAWEARNGLYDRVVCRICGKKISANLRPHLVHVHRMTIPEYIKEFRGAVVVSLATSHAINPVLRHKHPTVEQYAKSRAAHFLEPAKLIECRSNPAYEIEHRMAGIVCRECGLILRWRVVNKHLKAHGLNTITYRAKYGVTTPIQCAEIIARLKARYQRVIAQLSEPRGVVHGPKKTETHKRRFFVIGKKVETKIRSGKTLTAARQAVANEEGMDYDTVARYHKRYRKVAAEGGQG